MYYDGELWKYNLPKDIYSTDKKSLHTLVINYEVSKKSEIELRFVIEHHNLLTINCWQVMLNEIIPQNKLVKLIFNYKLYMQISFELKWAL